MVKPTGADGEKVFSKLTPGRRQQTRIRAAQLGLDLQDAVTQAIREWLADDGDREPVATSGATNFSTFLPLGLDEEFRNAASSRRVALTQGLAQAIDGWLKNHPPSKRPRNAGSPTRLIVCNQKGGVGKTAVSAGLGQAIAERGGRALLVDFDPQCHLTRQLGRDSYDIEEPSLAKLMLGEEKKTKLSDLIVPVEHDMFGGRLFLLPGSAYAFLLDAKLATAPNLRIRETALERELMKIEGEFDHIIVDCPPSLGYSMDNALYYGRAREDEAEGEQSASGVVIVVQAEDSSADAYDLLISQIKDLTQDMNLRLERLGIVVNLFDQRRGYIATSSLDQWRALGTPPVIGVVPDLKEQREAVRVKEPLLVYSPDSPISNAMRALARELTA
ncbi:ParA family protein [Streptomyces sp. NPDC097981]|uniref:ParA family protein n=1 Tax=Streptomyces sp. NPDC097981 TaxID=3155428 RepID=UPI003321D3E3